MLPFRLLKPLLDINKLKIGLRNYQRYWRDWKSYSRLPGSEDLQLENAYPCLYDRTSASPFDAHYFYQSVWALEKIKQSSVSLHIDVGSLVLFVGMVSAITKVTFIDIRPLFVNSNNFESKSGSILDMPFENNAVFSLSCLHVAEHIGLGRYGDPLDPLGTQKATKELARVLAPGGNLYFSVPIGKPRVCFNAHRIHSVQQIMGYFSALKLEEFSGVSDKGEFLRYVDVEAFSDSDYACGLFHFVKPDLDVL
jgi:SAM-dependent methyltransferase